MEAKLTGRTDGIGFMTADFWTIGFLILLAILIGILTQLPKSLRAARKGMAERSSFFRHTADLIVVLDEELKISEVNRSVLVRFRMNLKDIQGRRIEKTPFWPESPGEQRIALQSLRKAMDGHQALFVFTITAPSGDPVEFQVRVFPVPSHSRNQMNVVCFGKDITEEFGTRQRLKRRTEMEDVIARVLESAFAGGNARNTVPGILDVSGRFLGARRVFLLQTDRRGTIIWEHLWSAPGTPLLLEGWTDMNFKEMMPFEIKPGMTVLRNLAENKSIPEDFRSQARLSGMSSLVLLALTNSAGDAFGYMGFTFNDARPPEDASSSVLLKLLSATMTGLISRLDAQRDIELFRQSVDAAGQGMALIGPDGSVIYANETYRGLTGRTDETLSPVWNSYDGSFAGKVQNLIIPMVLAGERWTGELRIHGAESAVIDTIESFVPVETGSESPRYIINIITDISDRKRLEAQLITARKEAELANRAKSDYLASMSHEIRTPMNAVIGLAYLALQTDLDARQKDYLTKINTAAKGLLNIINDILDLSKIEAGKLELETAPFSLEELLENAAEMAAGKAREKGLKLLYFISQRMNDTWIGDRFRLGQVLLNLLSNAVKFTSEGHVIVSVGNDMPGYLRFTIEDSGIGMTEEQISRLFKPFQQAEASTTREFGGTGLGLTISKQIVEMMKGSITVSSQPNKGSRFEFIVNIARPNSGEAPAAPDDRDESRGTAFIVSIDPLIQEFHAVAFASIGYDTVVCNGLKEALENPNDPDVLVLDTDSCGKDPRTAAWALSDGMPEDFTLVLSGSEEEQELAAHCPPGVRHIVLPLPYGRTRLQEALDEIGPGKPAGGSANRGPGSTTVGGRILLADDNIINRQVGGEILAATGLTVDTAIDGREATEFCEREHYDLILMDLHMPVMDGYEAARIIRGKYPELPIIAMTASTLNDVKSEILDAGFTGYIAKPIDPNTVFRTISEVLNIPETALRSASSAVAADDNRDMDIPGIDTETAMRQVLGDKENFRRLIIAFAESHGVDDRNLRLPEDGEKEETIARLHALRGAAGHIGAMGVMDAAANLEDALRKGERPTEEEFFQLGKSLTVVTEGILTAWNAGKDRAPAARNHRPDLDELEELIRRSDEGAMKFLQERFGAQDIDSSNHYIRKIQNALQRWNFDEALDVVDDWRMGRNGSGP